MTLIVTVTIRKTLKATARKRKINIVIARELGTDRDNEINRGRNREIGSESDNDSDNVMTV